MSSELTSDLILKLELDQPSETVQKKALAELRETPQNIEKGLKELRALLKVDKDLVKFANSDERLLVFLRTCKFYPEGARDLIRSHYNTLHKYPEVIQLLLPRKLKHVFDADLVSILPQRDQHGRRIIVNHDGKNWDYKTISQDEIISSILMCVYFLQKEPETQTNGVVYILDLDGLGLGQALTFTLYVTKRCLDFTQSHSPLRMKGFHIVNQPKIFEPAFAAVKMFFSTKYSKRILMHGKNYASLHRYIDPECLPKYFGGTLNTKVMYGRETFQLLAPHEKFFEDFQEILAKN